MAHEEQSGKRWIGTFLLSLALWGCALLGTILLGHNLANYFSGH